jgi:hypothetical protein
MAILCSYCNYNNPDDSVVCLNCRKPLQQGSSSTDGLSQPNPSRTSTFQSNVPPPQPGGNTASFLPQAPQAPQTPNIPVGVQQSKPPIFQMGLTYTDPNSSAPSTHAFAGHGVLLTHQSWLLSESGAVAGDMLTTSFDICRRRGILNLNIEPRNLQEHSAQTETRHYLILRRGVTTVFLYIAPAGRDLYISRATTVLTSIDSVRLFTLIALMVIGFFCLISIVFSLAAIPIGLYLIWFFYRSIRYWLRERDFWVYLRKSELNDFQLDDVAIMEHVTDETLKAAAKLLKLDPDKIVAPTKGYEHERRIRVV